MAEIRKRKFITTEIFKLIFIKYDEGTYKISDLAKHFSIDRKTLIKIINQHEPGETFASSSIKRSATCTRINSTFNEEEKFLYKKAACEILSIRVS